MGSTFSYSNDCQLTKRHQKIILERLNRARARGWSLIKYLEDRCFIRKCGGYLSEVEKSLQELDSAISELFAMVQQAEIVKVDNIQMEGDPYEYDD